MPALNQKIIDYVNDVRKTLLHTESVVAATVTTADIRNYTGGGDANLDDEQDHIFSVQDGTAFTDTGSLDITNPATANTNTITYEKLRPNLFRSTINVNGRFTNGPYPTGCLITQTASQSVPIRVYPQGLPGISKIPITQYMRALELLQFSLVLPNGNADTGVGPTLAASGNGAANGTTVVDAAAYTANTLTDWLVTDTLAGAAAPQSQTRIVQSNTAGALTVFPGFTAQVDLADSYVLRPRFLTPYLNELQKLFSGSVVEVRTIAGYVSGAWSHVDGTGGAFTTGAIPVGNFVVLRLESAFLRAALGDYVLVGSNSTTQEVARIERIINADVVVFGLTQSRNSGDEIRLVKPLLTEAAAGDTSRSGLNILYRAALRFLYQTDPAGLFTPGAKAYEAGTAQAGGASTITLAASASATASFYVGWRVGLTGGTGIGQIRTISAYNGGTKVATVSLAWGTQPNNTTTYNLINPDSGVAVFDELVDVQRRPTTRLTTTTLVGTAVRFHVEDLDVLGLSLDPTTSGLVIQDSVMLGVGLGTEETVTVLSLDRSTKSFTATPLYSHAVGEMLVNADTTNLSGRTLTAPSERVDPYILAYLLDQCRQAAAAFAAIA